MPEPTVTYEWRIERLDVAPDEGGLTNIVRAIHWRLVATDGLNTADTYGHVVLSSPDPAGFIAYPELTQQIVSDWLTVAIDARAASDEHEEEGCATVPPTVANLCFALAGVLAAKRTPQVVPMPPPWP